MKWHISLILVVFILVGCTPKLIAPTDLISKADLVSTEAGKVIKRAGPLVTAVVCVAQPEYCTPAKAAYQAAVVTVNAIEAAKQAGDGTKVATLAREFATNIDKINVALVATGQEKIDLTTFQTTVKDLTISTQ